MTDFNWVRFTETQKIKYLKLNTGYHDNPYDDYKKGVRGEVRVSLTTGTLMENRKEDICWIWIEKKIFVVFQNKDLSKGTYVRLNPYVDKTRVYWYV